MNEDKFPLVSVVIPSYNHGFFITSAIESVINQDYKNIELIIIDDGSKDNSVDKIKSMIFACEQRFVRFEFLSRANKGLLKTLNEAFDWCRGDLISPLASDDGWFPKKISIQVEYLQKNTMVAACFCNVESIGVRSKKSFYMKNNIHVYDFEDIFLFQYNLPASTLMMHRSRVNFWPVFPENHLIEDFYLLLKITSTNKKVACLPDILGFYRQHYDNSSNVLYKKHAKDRVNILSEYSDHYLWRKAVAISMLIEATQELCFSKKEGLNLLISVIKFNPFAIISFRFFKFVLCFSSPKRILKKLF
jgi:alpha-1,3-rhamnosyltransferase